MVILLNVYRLASFSLVFIPLRTAVPWLSGPRGQREPRENDPPTALERRPQRAVPPSPGQPSALLDAEGDGAAPGARGITFRSGQRACGGPRPRAPGAARSSARARAS